MTYCRLLVVSRGPEARWGVRRRLIAHRPAVPHPWPRPRASRNMGNHTALGWWLARIQGIGRDLPACEATAPSMGSREVSIGGERRTRERKNAPSQAHTACTPKHKRIPSAHGTLGVRRRPTARRAWHDRATCYDFPGAAEVPHTSWLLSSGLGAAHRSLAWCARPRMHGPCSMPAALRIEPWKRGALCRLSRSGRLRACSCPSRLVRPLALRARSAQRPTPLTVSAASRSAPRSDPRSCHGDGDRVAASDRLA